MVSQDFSGLEIVSVLGTSGTDATGRGATT